MIISPQKPFLIDYQINNPADPDLDNYHVLATIKESISGKVIKTIPLASQGNGYYSVLWSTPGDTSGTGLQLSIFRSVYLDAGHTQLSPNYGTTLDTYIVQLIPLRPAGVSSGFGVSSGEIEKILRKVIAEIPKEKLELPKDRADEIITELQNSFREMKELVSTFNGDNDYRLEGTHEMIIDKMDGLEKRIGESVKGMLNEHHGSLSKTVADSYEKHHGKMDEMHGNMAAEFSNLGEMVSAFRQIMMNYLGKNHAADTKRAVDAAVTAFKQNISSALEKDVVGDTYGNANNPQKIIEKLLS